MNLLLLVLCLLTMFSLPRLRMARLERRLDELEQRLTFVGQASGVDRRPYRLMDAVALICEAEDWQGAKELLRRQAIQTESAQRPSGQPAPDVAAQR